MATNSTSPESVKVELDAEGKRLQLQAEKAKYIDAIAKAQQSAQQAKTPSLTALLPSLSDAPKGEVTLGDKAGALGPWRAHQIVDAVGESIANQVAAKRKNKDGRILVVGDRSLLQSHWLARQVTVSLERLDRRIRELKPQIETTHKEVTTRIKEIEDNEQGSNIPGHGDEFTQDHGTPSPSGPRARSAIADLSQPTPPTTTATAEPSPVGVTGALGGAVELLGLLRNDQTLTAGSVTAAPGELVTLTAGHLASEGIAVEADLFSTLVQSHSMDTFAEVLRGRDQVIEELSRLQQVLEPVDAELTAISVRVALIEKEWATATADASGTKTSDALRIAGDKLGLAAQKRERVAGPARTFIAYASKVIAEVDGAIGSLLAAPEGQYAPLFAAALRERLDRSNGKDAITDVLYVNLDALAVDTVTRRSMLGASGVLRFLSAGNASWLLLDTSTGAVTAGGQQHLGDLITFGLTTGEAKYDDAPGLTRITKGSISDPLAQIEGPVRWFVLALALVLAIVGVWSIVAIVLALT